MAIKIYCDFCEKEIDADMRSGKIGTFKMVSRAITLVQPTEPQQAEKVEVFQLCEACCDKMMVALKTKEPK